MPTPYVFPAATNWNNFPNGVFSPTVYSKKVQMRFRRTAVAQDITNTDYFGEIANQGDSVHIIKEPEIATFDYARGTKVVPQDLEDSEFILTVDRATAWAFKIDDIESQQAHLNWPSMAQDRAAYKLAQEFDKNILGYASGYVTTTHDGNTWVARTTAVGTAAQTTADSDELLAIHKLARDDFVSGGATTDSIAVGVQGTFDVTPLQVLNRMSRLLDEQNVPSEDRWVVLDPVFLELLSDENSKLVNNDYSANQDAGGQLRNGKITAGKIRGFTVYKSNNLPTLGTGPGTIDTNGSNANFGVIVAGHKSAVASAEQMAKTETLRAQDTFGDIVRGMHLYGRKILRPEALVRAIWNVSK